MEEGRSNFPYWIIIVLVAGLAIGATIYFFLQYQKTQRLLANPAEAARLQTQEIIAKVSKLAVVPVREEPTVATVSEVEKLKDKAFFANAQNGDKLIFYKNGRKAILYRPSENRIVEITTVGDNTQVETNTQTSTNTISPTPTATDNQTPATLIILNGTRITGLAGTAQSKIAVMKDKYQIVSTGNAQNRDSEKTIVVALNSAKQTEAQTLADLIGGSVGPLPDGELTPQADLLVILGKDYQTN